MYSRTILLVHCTRRYRKNTKLESRCLCQFILYIVFTPNRRLTKKVGARFKNVGRSWQTTHAGAGLLRPTLRVDAAATGARPPSGMPAAPHASARACAPPAMPPCAAASFLPTDPHLQCSSSLATDIKELYSAGQRATSGARESPLTMPFILGERDTKDSAHTLLDMPKNKRRRLDKNLKRQAAFSPLCSPFARVCARRCR